MLYSKRRKNLGGGGLRKRSNRKFNSSKRAKRGRGMRGGVGAANITVMFDGEWAQLTPLLQKDIKSLFHSSKPTGLFINLKYSGFELTGPKNSNVDEFDKTIAKLMGKELNPRVVEPLNTSPRHTSTRHTSPHR